MEPRLSPRKLLYPCLFLTYLALANGLLLMPEGSPLRVAAAMALLLLPGLAWAEALFPAAGRLMRWSIGAGLSYALAMIVGLILHYLPGPVAFWHELVALDVLALVPTLALFVAPRPVAKARSDNGDPSDFVTLSLLVAILALAVFFCFTNLGYNEFQGDEVKVITPAANALQGNPDALLLGRKRGAGEVLLVMLLWRLTGTIAEATARLPFAAAGVFAVLAAYLIARRLAGERAGLIAAALLTLNGFWVAFAHVVQYQSIVMWMSALALLCAWEWRASLQSRWAALVGVLLGTGLSAHFDVLVIVPVLAYGVVVTHFSPTGKEQVGSPRRSLVRSLLIVAALFLVASAPVFVPYLLSADKSTQTAAYLGDRIGTDILNNRLDNFLSTGIFYTSFYYLLVTGILLLGFLAWAIHRIRVIRRLPGSGYWVPALVVVVALAPMVWPQALSTPDLDLAVVPFAVILLGVFLSPALTAYQRDIVVWLAVSFLGYNFLVGDPRSHIYVIALPWVILAGLAASRLWNLAPPTWTRRWQTLLAVCGVLLVLLFGGYVYIAYLRHDVEFLREWPTSRVALYWAPPPYDEPLPGGVGGGGYFGFPRQRGWKGIGALYASGRLMGGFDANEQPEVVAWYVGDAVVPSRIEMKACGGPEYYFIADDLADGKFNSRSIKPAIFEAGYDAIGRIELPNGKGITLYQARPGTGNLGDLDIADLAMAFDSAAVPATFVPSPMKPSHLTQANLQGTVRLVGYDIDLRRATPGGRMDVTLYWQALAKIPVDLHVFVHLEGLEGETETTGAMGIWGQSDSTPGCRLYPTSGWNIGQTIVDRHIFPIKPDTPTGDYTVLAGMYSPKKGIGLDVWDEAGNPAGNFVKLTTVSIRR